MTNLSLNWQDISDAMHTFTPASGGFTKAKRGLVTLQDGTNVFIKEATDNTTTLWLQKELKTYQFLNESGYVFSPRLLAVNEDRTAMALEALTEDEGWSWESNWDEDRLVKTLAAMESLAEYSNDAQKTPDFNTGMISPTTNWWEILKNNDDRMQLLVSMQADQPDQYASINIDVNTLYKRSLNYHVRTDTLVHNDVRADNCAWNNKLSKVRLVDWNWCQLSDPSIDRAAFFIHVERSGLKISSSYLDEVDPGAFLWLAGFWLNSASSTISENRSEIQSLRQHQLESGLIALKNVGI